MFETTVIPSPNVSVVEERSKRDTDGMFSRCETLGPLATFERLDFVPPATLIVTEFRISQFDPWHKRSSCRASICTSLRALLHDR